MNMMMMMWMWTGFLGHVIILMIITFGTRTTVNNEEQVIDNACKKGNTHNYSKYMFSYVTHVRMITHNTTSGNIHLKYQL
jgi:hypothetical protein